MSNPAFTHEPRVKFGPWHKQGPQYWIYVDEPGALYDVDLRWQTPMNWLLHLKDKRWFTPEVCGHLVLAMIESGDM